MVRHNKSMDPSEYESMDIEAALRPEPSAAQDAAVLQDNPRPKRRRAPPGYREDSEQHQYWLVCPCTRCARKDKPHVRLHSTVIKHIRQHLMADKYKVCDLSSLKFFRLCQCRSTMDIYDVNFSCIFYFLGFHYNPISFKKTSLDKTCTKQWNGLFFYVIILQIISGIQINIVRHCHGYCTFF